MSSAPDGDLDIYKHQGFATPMGIGEAPAVLVLQLKRFEFSARSRTKLGKVRCPWPRFNLILSICCANYYVASTKTCLLLSSC